MAQESLGLKNIRFAYEGKPSRALDNISLSFFPGDFAGIIGSVGSGKTTLLCCCNGLIPKEMHGKFSGSVGLLGQPLSALGFRQIAKMCSMVFQDPDDQIFNLTVLDEVAFGPISTGSTPAQAAAAAKSAIAKVGLELCGDEDPSELSSGQKQKVAIACALAQDSPVILLDEPVSSLDWKSACEVYDILSSLAKEGKTIVITEQDTCLLAKHANRVIVMEKGKVILDGKQSALFGKEVARLGLRAPAKAGKSR
jgi:energy-coupling factor transport system ATP-binding protein